MFKKIENLYLLLETKQLLQRKLEELKETKQSYQLVEEDIRKIEKEMLMYTEGELNQDPDKLITTSLFNPASYMINEKSGHFNDLDSF